MQGSHKTILYERHVSLEANMVEFGGWRMPLHYKNGIVEEHLAARKQAGLFDVSHMGRFAFRGKSVVSFLQHVLSNNVEALEVGQAQYTIIPDRTGGAIDDAYLYRFFDDEYLLVVNAANREKDWSHFQKILGDFDEVKITDKSQNVAMLSLQGPCSKSILNKITDPESLPEPVRNTLNIADINGAKILIGATGYTGEPLCFELFADNEEALMLWDLLIEQGAVPVGLGARDTLRLEAGLPLYGHELGTDPEGKQIPIFSCSVSRFAVSFSPLKGDFVGRAALTKQFEAFKRIWKSDYSLTKDLPRLIKPVALLEKGIARAGAKVFADGKHAGFITSGTMVPYWKIEGMRAICLALLDSNLRKNTQVEVEIRGKMTKAVIVPFHLDQSSVTPNFAGCHTVGGAA